MSLAAEGMLLENSTDGIWPKILIDLRAGVEESLDYSAIHGALRNQPSTTFEAKPRFGRFRIERGRKVRHT